MSNGLSPLLIGFKKILPSLLPFNQQAFYTVINQSLDFFFSCVEIRFPAEEDIPFFFNQNVSFHELA